MINRRVQHHTKLYKEIVFVLRVRWLGRQLIYIRFQQYYYYKKSFDLCFPPHVLSHDVIKISFVGCKNRQFWHDPSNLYLVKRWFVKHVWIQANYISTSYTPNAFYWQHLWYHHVCHLMRIKIFKLFKLVRI